MNPLSPAELAPADYSKSMVFYGVLASGIMSSLAVWRRQRRKRAYSNDVLKDSESRGCDSSYNYDQKLRNRRLQFYRALPKTLHIRLSKVSTKRVRQALFHCIDNGVVYAELEVDVLQNKQKLEARVNCANCVSVLDVVKHRISTIARILEEFEDQEKARFDHDQMQYYNNKNRYSSASDGPLHKCRLSLIPRLIIDITSLIELCSTTTDFREILNFMCDPFKNSWCSIIVGVSFDHVKVGQRFLT